MPGNFERGLYNHSSHHSSRSTIHITMSENNLPSQRREDSAERNTEKSRETETGTWAACKKKDNMYRKYPGVHLDNHKINHITGEKLI